MQAKEAAGDAVCDQGCEWSHSVSGYSIFQDTCATDTAAKADESVRSPAGFPAASI